MLWSSFLWNGDCISGYTIPAGWVIMVVNSALHLNPTTFKDPLEFNPWRWKVRNSTTKQIQVQDPNYYSLDLHLLMFNEM